MEPLSSCFDRFLFPEIIPLQIRWEAAVAIVEMFWASWSFRKTAANWLGTNEKKNTELEVLESLIRRFSVLMQMEIL